MPFADLLQWASQSRKSGTLLLDGPEFSKKLYFRDGAVVAVASDNPREFLGFYLVGWSLLDEDELQELLDMQDRYGTMLGELLVIVGRLSREELDYLLRIKTEEAIYELFLWPEADFKFLDDILPERKFQPADVTVDTLILEGIRRLDEMARIVTRIPSASWVPRLVRAVEVRQMGESELTILREINGRNSIEDIALACRLGTFAILEYVFQGVEAGLIAVAAPEHERTEIPGFSKGAWKLLLKKANELARRGELRAAYLQLVELRSRFGADHASSDEAEKTEAELERQLVERQLTLTAVVELAIPMADLTTMGFSPEEGFLLSRVNGLYSLGEISTLVPGSQLELRLTVDALIRRGVLRLKGAAAT
jgi:hypothetical protein